MVLSLLSRSLSLSLSRALSLSLSLSRARAHALSLSLYLSSTIREELPSFVYRKCAPNGTRVYTGVQTLVL